MLPAVVEEQVLEEESVPEVKESPEPELGRVPPEPPDIHFHPEVSESKPEPASVQEVKEAKRTSRLRGLFGKGKSERRR